MTAPIVALDTETTGLSLTDDIWEFAGIRREPDGTEFELHLFIEHDEKKCARLPESFRADHLARYPSHNQAASRVRAANQIANFMEPTGDQKVHVVGAVPNFDTERIALLLEAHAFGKPKWHYHLIDVENLAVGYLAGLEKQAFNDAEAFQVDLVNDLAPPWDSDTLSRAVGVEPPGEGERHTALGDARWVLRLYDAIVGGQLGGQA